MQYWMCNMGQGVWDMACDSWLVEMGCGSGTLKMGVGNCVRAADLLYMSIHDQGTRTPLVKPAEPKDHGTARIVGAWFALLMGVLAMSCVGPFVQQMAGVNGLLKSAWIVQGMFWIFLVINGLTYGVCP